MMYGLWTIIIAVIGIAMIIIGSIIEDYDYDILKIFLILGGVFTIMLCLLPSYIVYETQEAPLIEKQIHNQCINEGFDTFESWNGIGLFPLEAIYVKCKFVDNRRDIQGITLLDTTNHATK